MLFSHLAAVTERIEFVTQRARARRNAKPPLAAKQIATIDLLSGGRIARGRRRRLELRRVRRPRRRLRTPHRRPRRADRRHARALDRARSSDYEGRFHHLDGVGINPLPSRLIPIYMGTGGSDAALRRVVAQGRRVDAAAAARPRPDRLPHRSRTAASRSRGRRPRSRRRCRSTGASTSATDGRSRSTRALEVGVESLSVGFPRLAAPKATHAEHLKSVLDAKSEIDRLVS